MGSKFNLQRDIDDTEQSILLQLQSMINEYLLNGKIDLFEKLKEMDIELDLKGKFKTDFSEKVMKALLNVKPGDYITYSELAERINSKAYRAVGSVLKNNPLPLIIPCHRVVSKGGKIGGFMGKTNKGWQIHLKQTLLELEGNTTTE